MSGGMLTPDIRTIRSEHLCWARLAPSIPGATSKMRLTG
ncbi:UNVERIFIED_CONTAM: hypothetical protein GTU68_038623 [Idotea baltica]|nr:hypothetical protein [Idotea baltica]